MMILESGLLFWATLYFLQQFHWAVIFVFLYCHNKIQSTPVHNQRYYYAVSLDHSQRPSL